MRPGRVVRTVRDPRDYGIARCALDDLRGGDAATNASRLREALAGRDTAAHRDALVLGAALALEVTGQCSTRRAASRARARRSRAERVATSWRASSRSARSTRSEHVAHCSDVPRTHGRKRAASASGCARAAESEAKLARRALAHRPRAALEARPLRRDRGAQATLAGGRQARGTAISTSARSSPRYARGGAAAVSVLTEPTEFKGELAHLEDAAAR